MTLTPLAQWALAAREMYEALSSAGFTEEQALTMVADLLRPQAE
jgi:hypothetical protein